MLKRLSLLYVFLSLLAFDLASRVSPARNYLAPDGPLSSGSFATATAARQTFTVVSYNIRYARQIEQAAEDLRAISGALAADLILLQEMDEAGAERLARALKTNYIYFPAAVHPQSERNFGNAILSPWPISAPGKLILPHRSPLGRMIRVATQASVALPGMVVDVYSTHTETLLSWPSHRRNQVAAILQDIDPASAHVIIGGDFNSVGTGQVDDLTGQFAAYGLEHASAGTGPTVFRWGLAATADHIFSRGFKVIEAGRLATATASDHLPVWVRLAPNG